MRHWTWMHRQGIDLLSQPELWKKIKAVEDEGFVVRKDRAAGRQ